MSLIRLPKKLILEFYEDKEKDDTLNNKDTTLDIPTETPTELSEDEKRNFMISVLSDIQNKSMDLFNYIGGILSAEDSQTTLEQENRDLLNSIYEDVSLVIGKVQQGIKENSEEDIQDIIGQGEEETQEKFVSSEDSSETQTKEEDKKD